jgi:hypothetical protein
MGNTRWNPHPASLILPECDALQTTFLKNDQIDGPTQHQQLIGLPPVAEEGITLAETNFGDECLIAGLGR